MTNKQIAWPAAAAPKQRLASRDTPSVDTAVGVNFADLPVLPDQEAPLRFTFFWTQPGTWEGRDFAVGIDRSR